MGRRGRMSDRDLGGGAMNDVDVQCRTLVAFVHISSRVAARSLADSGVVGVVCRTPSALAYNMGLEEGRDMG
jgi:hypothetical protein